MIGQPAAAIGTQRVDVYASSEVSTVQTATRYHRLLFGEPRITNHVSILTFLRYCGAKITPSSRPALREGARSPSGTATARTHECVLQTRKGIVWLVHVGDRRERTSRAADPARRDQPSTWRSTFNWNHRSLCTGIGDLARSGTRKLPPPRQDSRDTPPWFEYGRRRIP